MIERIQIWLDARPRTRFTLRTAAASVAALLYVGVFAFGFGIAGVIVAGLVIIAVNVAGPIEFTSIDVVWGAWATSLSFGAIIGAIAGVIHTLRRLLRTDPDEHRSRTVIARDLVAQAVVSHRIGAEYVRLQLGLLGGGGVWWIRTSPQPGGPSATDQAYDRLTVAMANPSLTSIDIRVEQRRTWFAEISRLAEEIVILGAAAGITEDDHAELIRGAARRAHTILAVEDDLVMTAIRAELRVAGSIRSDRVQTLLGSVPEEPATAGALVANHHPFG